MAPETFSTRFGYKPTTAEITIREDAPENFREAIVALGEHAGLGPFKMRRIICAVLLKKPDQNNWSEYPNIKHEVDLLIQECPWYRVYEIAEQIHEYLKSEIEGEKNLHFQSRLNEFMLEHGIGWEMKNGQFYFRGSEQFTKNLTQAHQTLESSDHLTASNELDEAIKDLSRRPNPDITGAITHAMSALECVARDISGNSNATLGASLKGLNIPKPLDSAIERIWGYASENARHVREGNSVNYEEAELVVTLAAAMASYLSKRITTE